MKATAREIKVISFPASEKTEKEIDLDREVDYLVSVMRELILVEKLTGRKGLPSRVLVSVHGILSAALRLAEA